MIIKKYLTISIPAAKNIDILEHYDRIKKFLENSNFRNILKETDKMTAERGSYFASIFNIGDPRRHHSRIFITNSEIKYVITTWFSIFSENDIAVFKIEGNELQKALFGDFIIVSQSMDEVQAERRKSDVKIIFFLVLMGIVLGLTAAIISIKFYSAGIFQYMRKILN